MSAKDYILIAERIRSSVPSFAVAGSDRFKRITEEKRQGERRRLGEHFADALAATNPRFDRERFVNACMGA